MIGILLNEEQQTEAVDTGPCMEYLLQVILQIIQVRDSFNWFMSSAQDFRDFVHFG